MVIHTDEIWPTCFAIVTYRSLFPDQAEPMGFEEPNEFIERHERAFNNLATAPLVSSA